MVINSFRIYREKKNDVAWRVLSCRISKSLPFRKTLLINKKLSRFRIEPALLLAALFFSPQPQVVVRATLIILMFSITHLALKPVVIKRYHKRPVKAFDMAIKGTCFKTLTSSRILSFWLRTRFRSQALGFFFIYKSLPKSELLLLNSVNESVFM